MQITKMLVPESKYNIKCPDEMTPEFIVIHNTANDASAMSEISYMIGNNNKVSYHCAIDNYRVVQGIPEILGMPETEGTEMVTEKEYH